jgi:hypothetical protein
VEWQLCDTGQFILHCVRGDSDKGCSTTRGRWFGSGLPVEERQTCWCIRRRVKTTHFSLTAVLASSIIRNCDATFLHTPLPPSRLSDLRGTVIWLLRTIIRLFSRTNIYVYTTTKILNFTIGSSTALIRKVSGSCPGLVTTYPRWYSRRSPHFFHANAEKFL